MRATFYGLDIANKGLFVAQRNIDVTAHNVSNVNTEGYTRQRFVQASVDPMAMYHRFAPVDQGAIGGGVRTKTLDQIRDLFLDRQYRNENTKTQYWETRSNALYYIEDVFNSIDENSLDGIMASFFNAIQELSKNPTDKAIRKNVEQSALKMTDVMHMYADQLTDLMLQQDLQVVEQVKQVNEMLDQMAVLNDHIFKFELCGQPANDLRDKRNLLLDRLSGMMNINYVEEVAYAEDDVDHERPLMDLNGVPLTRLKLWVGSSTEDEFLLVDHIDAFHLYCEQDASNYVLDNLSTERDVSLLHSVYLASDTELHPDEVEGLFGGSILSCLDLRDGLEPNKQGIPYFMQQLDVFVGAFVREFNEVHRQGWTMPYDGFSSETGVDFFDASRQYAFNFSLSEEVLENPFNIAASSVQVIMDAIDHLETGNNENVLALIAHVRERTDLDDVGSFEGYYRSFLGALASEVAHANEMTQSQYVLTDSLESQRVSVSGVSVDEEMTNMIRFQHAYSAAARTITAMDEALDVLINRTGRVGL